jgi:molecular chaperone DnaK
MYALGIDLGTTYTAAATWRDGNVEIASLGSRSAAIPSVVLLREDESFLVGEAAHRRGLTEPHRVSREFKRRLGDTTPILLGGVPYSAEALMARLLRAVVGEVSQREGAAPSAISISHPANWGPYKTDLLSQAARLANLDQPATLLTEPEAAAMFYAQQQRIEPGAIVAVYDLGGGTFDAAVLRKAAQGFEILGRPEGIERLGGIDFDAAVFAHVQRTLGETMSDLEEDDPQVVAAVARLRDECVAAKETLSTDTDTTIPVLLPRVSTEVRLTRAELEDMVRPALHETVQALRRTLATAQVPAEQLHSVLLVGGSSRMPIAAQLVGAELGRPVAVDAHPKHAIAAGVAWAASAQLPAPAASRQRPSEASQPAPIPAPSPAPSPTPTRAPAFAVGTAQVPSTAPPASRSWSLATPGAAALDQDRGVEAGGGAGRLADRLRVWLRGPRAWQTVTGLVVGALVIAGGVALAQPGGGGGAPDQRDGGVPVDEQCTDEIRANPRWICLTSASFDDQGRLVVEYDAEWGDELPDRSAGFHMHLYGGDGVDPPAETMGNQAAEPGAWYIEDADPAVIPADRVPTVIGDAPKVCARISDGTHHLVRDTTGGFATGNCTRISR